MANFIIVGEEYCKPEPVELAFSTTINGEQHKELTVTDLNGQPVFWLASDVAIKNKWFILDAATGLPLLSIVKKKWHLHKRWQAFRGEGTDENNHLFTVKKSSILKSHKEWDVFLAANTKEVEWDFKITGKYNERSIKVVHKRDPTAVIAEMSQHEKVVKVRLATDAFAVTISPNIDFAFIASLISMLHLLQQRKDAHKKSAATFGKGTASGLGKGVVEGVTGGVVEGITGGVVGAAVTAGAIVLL